MHPPTAEQQQVLDDARPELTGSSRGSSLFMPSQGNASPNSTTSSFDPENEALESTRQFDNVVDKLPQLRASAQKYNRFSRVQPQSEPDYAIDTSAIGRAFPDFTQGGSPSDGGPSDPSASIEVGRGHTKNSTGTISQLARATSRSPRSEPSVHDGGTFEFSAPIARNQSTATSSLKMPKNRNLPNDVRANPARNVPPRRPSGVRSRANQVSPSLVKTQDNGSGSSRQTSAENRQTLTAINARIRDEMEASHISEERPPSPELTVRSSRFGGTRKQVSAQSEPLPVRFASRQSFASEVPHPQPARIHAEPLRDAAQPNNATQQSAPGSELPNVSELLSGVYEDGTPVFSRHSKPRTTRISSRQSSRPDPGQVDDVAVPFDEQAIVLSLKLLQDKVAELERERAQTENFLDELQLKNDNLEWEKAQRRSRQRSDSAIGLTDGGSDGGDDMGGRRKLLIERNRLESSVRALQSHVESSDRKAATSETALRNVTHERDSAVSQLGVAYLTIEQLKVDNAELARENSALRAKLAGNDGKEMRPHHSGPSHHETEGSRHRTAPKPVRTEHPMPNPADGKPKPKRSITEMRANLEAAAAAGAERDAAAACQAASSLEAAEARDIRGRSIPVEPHVTDLFPRVEQAPKRDFSFAPSHISEDSDRESTQIVSSNSTSHKPSQWPLHHQHQEDGTPQVTDVSYRSAEQAANERLMKEFGRKHSDQQGSAHPHIHDANQHYMQTQNAEKSQQPNQDLIGKPSIKSANRNVSDQTELSQCSFDQTGRSQSKKVTSEHCRRRSEPAAIERQVPKKAEPRSHRRHRSTENISSAFVLPHTSIHHSHVETRPQISAPAVAETVTKDSEIRGSQSHPHTVQPTVSVGKPVPVSERMPEPSEYNEEPTIRPSQSPGLALARVIRGMDQEVATLKSQLKKASDLYNAHDVSLSKRARESLARKIRSLLEASEAKAQQVYYLYDVLEGQKQAGQTISEQEVDEPTLQSIGINPDDAAKAADTQPLDLEGVSPWESLASAGMIIAS
ncbi:MAG: hypothetical protein Q9191_007252 [Dirinaria sp. TL-2023a]